MRQRVALAMALLCQPRLLIADEPTSALDVTIQAQVLELIRDLRAQLHLALLLITHDLAIIAQTCDRVLVVYAGRVVESGVTAELLAAPRHPYTRGLLAARPQLKAPEAVRLQGIPGAPPDPRKPSGGCAFAPRCSRADARCEQAPGLAEVAPRQFAACWHPHPV
jgi:oligopeptide/dipeptide ABC transporter ATP-binding protein